ncbi:beta-propeller fold lactonase family protein [Cupriavidus basilensis]
MTPDQRLSPQHLVALLPESFTGNSRAAGVALEPRSMTLFISSRGHDGVTCIALKDRDTGLPAGGHLDFCRGPDASFPSLPWTRHGPPAHCGQRDKRHHSRHFFPA